MRCGLVIFNSVCENVTGVTLDVACLVNLMMIVNLTIQRQMMDDRNNELEWAWNVEVQILVFAWRVTIRLSFPRLEGGTYRIQVNT
jgi:hypothetical protein